MPGTPPPRPYGGWENVPGIPGATRNFAYLVRGLYNQLPQWSYLLATDNDINDKGPLLSIHLYWGNDTLK